MLQNIIVLIIVSVAIFFTCRRLYRILFSRKAKSGCLAEEDCSACSVPNNTEESGFGGS